MAKVYMNTKNPVYPDEYCSVCVMGNIATHRKPVIVMGYWDGSKHWFLDYTYPDMPEDEIENVVWWMDVRNED